MTAHRLLSSPGGSLAQGPGLLGGTPSRERRKHQELREQGPAAPAEGLPLAAPAEVSLARSSPRTFYDTKSTGNESRNRHLGFSLHQTSLHSAKEAQRNEKAAGPGERMSANHVPDKALISKI